jgi:FkbM family methyltransferase
MVPPVQKDKAIMIKTLFIKFLRRILPSAAKSRLIQLYHCILLVRVCHRWAVAVLDRADIRLRKHEGKHINITLRTGGEISIIMGDLDAQRIAEIFGERVYTPRSLWKYWRNAEVVFDIGANKGIFTIYAAGLLPKATIHAYEPNPDLFPRLQENILLNNLHDRCVPLNYAVWHKSGVLQFRLDNPKNPGTGQIISHSQGTYGFQEVPAIALAEILHRHQAVDFIKMDIEGAEYFALLRTPGEYLRKIKFIALEYHDHDDFDVGDLIEHLKAAQFSVSFRSTGSILYAWQPVGQ